MNIYFLKYLVSQIKYRKCILNITWNLKIVENLKRIVFELGIDMPHYPQLDYLGFR